MANKSGKLNQANSGSKSANFETNTRTDDLVLAETAFLVPKEEKEITDKDVEKAIVYEGGVTSIDFMMPEDERAILEENLNNYGDVEKMQKVLNIAKKNKLLHEDIQTLNQIAKTDLLIDNIFDILNDPRNLKMLTEHIQKKFDESDPAKAYKEIGLINKAMMDAREGMLKRMRAKASGKKAKIALKFTNDSGEEYQLGAEIDE